MNHTAFQFEAMTKDGGAHRGVTQAPSVDEAFAQITASGLTPIRIDRIRKRARFGGSKAISLRDLSVFTYQFSVLIEARIPISEGLRSIAEEESNERFRVILDEIATSISAGSTITEALETHRELFGDVYLQTIHAAEESGNLVLVLQHLAEMLDREVEMRAQLRSAMIYPVSVISMLVLAVIFLLIVVVPRFSTMFEARDVALPLPTQILITISQLVTGSWWILLPFVAAGAYSLRKMWRSSTGSLRLDRLVHRIPIVRTLLQAAAISRFANVFGISLASGLSLIDCLEMGGRASARPMLITDANKMAEQVAKGGRLTDVLATCPYMTGFVRRLLSAGEQSADLPAMCHIIARHYDREVQHLAKNMSSLIEPIMVVLLAGVVLFIALAIFLPMWNMMAVVGG